jgi:hypothetical protein
VEVALDATAHQVKKMTRAYKGVLRTAELEASNDRHAERFLTYHHDHDGCLMISARLSPEDGAVVIAALEAARKAITATPPFKEPADPAQALSCSQDLTASAEATSASQDLSAQATSCSQVLTASAEATFLKGRDATRAEDFGAAQVAHLSAMSSSRASPV